MLDSNEHPDGNKSLRAFFWNSIGAGFGKFSVLALRLFQAPVLLSYLGASEYGVWLLLSTLPSWLSVANCGFGSVASNEMSLLAGAGDHRGANCVFSSACAVVTALMILGVAVTIPFALIIPWHNWLGTHISRNREIAYATAFLSASVFISFWGELQGGRFRVAGKAYESMLFSAVRPWCDIVFLVIFLHYSSRFDLLALSTFCSSILFFLLYWWNSTRVCPTIYFRYSLVDWHWFNRLIRKGIAFQAFPLGNAILFQGSLLIVQYVLGSIAVAAFGTARTLVRLISQFMELINQAVWPELTLLIGAGNLRKAAQLHRISVFASILISAILTVFLAFFGLAMFNLWTGSKIELTQFQLILFLIPVPFNAFWFTSMVVHTATNRHEDLAKRYLVATTFGAVACFFLCNLYGLEGAAISSVCVDLLLVPFVFRRSLDITNDTLGGFFTNLGTDLTLLSRYQFWRRN